MGEQTKEKILRAAMDEFIEKGFDRSRVEDIARRAGLTKVMVYYHFSSKENMMSELIALTIADVRDRFREKMAGVDILDRESVRSRIAGMYDYLYANREAIGLVTAETLRSGHTGSLSAYENLYQAIATVFAPGGPASVDQNDLLIKVFFFNSLPMILYATLSDQLNHDLGLDPLQSREAFLDTFIDVLYANLSR